jgi:poly-gamma-glutamate capsule biosynthesis protein CapA/YwtB (metallophosphatase superfamily)
MQWILLTGDAMLGRGVDQLNAVSNDPAIPDRLGRDAIDFVRLAEARNGPIPRAVEPGYVWGDALDALAPFETALRIVNLETAITTAPVFDPTKRIHYRMHPANIGVLKAFAPDCCVLANNHVLDWGEDGLRETLNTLDAAGIARAGAGFDPREAWRPVILPLPDGTRVIVLAMGDRSAGVPYQWAATPERPGLAVLGPQVEPSIAHVARIIAQVKRPGDIAVASIHWGENWGFEIPERQTALARGLIDRAGIDVVHGHSSHHPKQVALYRGKLLLAGCGELISDIEGLAHYGKWRPDLVVLYLVGIEGGAVRDFKMLPMRMRRIRLERPSPDEVRWLCERATHHSAALGTGWGLARDGTIRLTRRKPRQPAEAPA